MKTKISKNGTSPPSQAIHKLNEMMYTSHNNVIKKNKKSYLSFSLETLIFLLNKQSFTYL
jgi:hypothetical protein